MEQRTQGRRKLGNESDEKEPHLIRRHKRGTGKYKGNLLFKHFNCGRVGHYAKKFPLKEKKIFHKKNSLYSKEDSISSDENNGE
jgi:hypothetical protein